MIPLIGGFSFLAKLVQVLYFKGKAGGEWRRKGEIENIILFSSINI
jgi:hypothetical protein